MSLADRTLRSIPSILRERGTEYFRNGKVRVYDGSDTAAAAFVQGTDRYDVTLELEDRRLWVDCDCPYFADHEVCKHIWATILAADESPYLSAATRGRGALALGTQYDDEGDSDDDLDDDLDEEADALSAHYTAPRPLFASLDRRGRTPEMPPWRRLLEAAQGGPGGGGAAAQPVEIAYVLDATQNDGTGRVVVEIARRKAPSKKNAESPGFAPFQVDRGSVETLARPEDRAILGALVGAEERMSHGSHYYDYGRYYRSAASRFVLSPTMQAWLLPMMCETGRCYIRRTPREAEIAALRWDGGAAWKVELRVAEVPGRRANDPDWEVAGALSRGGETIPLDRIGLLGGPLAIAGDTVVSIEGDDAKRWIAGFPRNARIRVPAAERRAFFEQIHALPSAPPIELPPGWNVPEVPVTPSPRLLLHAPKPEARPGTPIYGALSFDYDRFEIAAEKPGRAAFDADRWRLLPRSPSAESAARDRLADLSFRPIDRSPYYALHRPEGAHLEIAPRHVPKAVRTLVAEGWHVEASGQLYKRPGAFEMGITSGIDWFELSAKVDFEGISADLAAVLAALKRGDHTIVLDDGSVGVLPEEWLSKYGLFVEMGTIEAGKIRYRKSQIGVLDALVSAQPGIEVDRVFEQARAELSRGASVTPEDPPETFRGTLRPYQRDGLGWLSFLRRFGFGGCLADDMGLGKTVQVLALLAAKKQEGRRGPTLVVAPRSLIFNWKAEAARFTPDLRVLDHTGADRLPPGEHFANHDIVLTTYGTLRRDAEALSQTRFAYAILDEAQAIKNDKSGTAKAARRIEADHRLALSGTPIENHLGELWSLFEFLNPGILGRASAFKGTSGRADLPPETLALLSRALRPFILRRTKAAVAKDLPDKLEETWMCELQGKQRALYDELRNHYRASLQKRVAKEGLAKSKIHVLEALLRLRQAACHPGLLDARRAGEPSAKLDALFAELPVLRENGHKALVFSQFTSLLAIVKKKLDAGGVPYEYLDGQTRDRAARVDRFQSDPSCPLFLVSLKAGGLGLNLTAAEYVFLLDPWWNPAVEAQAIDRAHRIGQTKPVFAYRLIAKDTIEERIAELQKTKRHLAESVIEADASLIRELTAEDLDLLLS